MSTEEKELKPEFNKGAEYIDPSVLYAEAFMAGESQVTVPTPNGDNVTYVFGRETRSPQ